jgi:RNA polymerase sigma-70 factor (ECF subfamily)
MSSEAALKFPESIIEAVPTSETRPTTDDSVTSHALRQGLDTLPDEELLEAVGKGSKDALSVLFRRHGRAVLNVASRILRDESEADDLRQEVFLYLFERASHYERSKCSASSWIIQITYHRAIDRRRFLTSRQHYRSEVFEEQRDGPEARELSTDQIDGKALLERLRNQLTPDQQETLELHVFEGYTFREIAEQRGQSVGNIRHHYYRALDRLRSSIFSKKSA